MRRYGLEEGDAVALFSGNTIWYPVAMFAVGRAGLFFFLSFFLSFRVKVDT